MKKQFVLFLFQLLCAFTVIQSQTKLYDHSIAIERLKNSENELFAEILEEYNSFLFENPNNLEVLLERIQFINSAQYDEYNEANPNQALFDSLLNSLLIVYPEEPEVLLYQMKRAWGDSLANIFTKAEQLIAQNKNWTREQKGKLYLKMAERFYYDDDYKKSHTYINKAIQNDSSYKKELTYCNILLSVKDSAKAKEVLLQTIDTSQASWVLKRKANLLVDLKSYDKALELYNLIQEKDSSVIQADKMAEIFEGVHQYQAARSYLLKDTSSAWSKNKAMLRLFKHDLHYQNSELAYQSYNAYRDLAFSNDPLGLYRIHLLINHPSSGWTLRDIGAILLLLLLTLILILIPSIWVFPLYFIGHYYNIKASINLGNIWGLKAMWFVSAAFLISSLLATLPSPEDLNYYFKDSNYYEEDNTTLALSQLIFMLCLAGFTLVLLFKKNLRILGSILLPYRKVFFMVLGYFFLYKLASGLYIKTGSSLFDIENPLGYILNNGFLLSSRDEVVALLQSYGLLSSLLTVAFLVPIYEEIMFRGVILEAATKRITFKWANIFQAFLFALVHGDLFLFPIFFAFGIITGNLRKKTGGLFGGILFHVINNFLATLSIYGKMDINLKALIFFGG